MWHTLCIMWQPCQHNLIRSFVIVICLHTLCAYLPLNSVIIFNRFCRQHFKRFVINRFFSMNHLCVTLPSCMHCKLGEIYWNTDFAEIGFHFYNISICFLCRLIQPRVYIGEERLVPPSPSFFFGGGKNSR